MTAEITRSFAEGFGEVGDGQPLSVSPSSIMLDGRVYLVDTNSGDYARQGVEVVQQRNTSDNRDILLLPQGVWRQQVQSWHQGCGQGNLDRNDALEFRYRDSFGVDPWTKYELSLLRETEELGSVGASDVFLQVHGDYLVAGEGTALRWWTALSGSPTSLTVGSTNITSMTYDGDSIITLHSNGDVYKSTTPSATVLFGSFPSASFVAYVKDYLIAGINNVLSNITSGTPSTIYTSPVSGFRWVGACEGDRGIYVLGGSGDKWVIHRLGIKDDATGLLPAVVAATLPDGEVGYAIGSYLGFVFVGTSAGVRMAQASQSGELVLGAVIPTSSPPLCFEGQDRFVWYGNSAIDSTYGGGGDEADYFPAGTVCGLGRMDLTTFTVTSLTPAYANDLVCLTETGKSVQSVTTFLGKRVFAIKDGGIWFEGANLMEAGWLSQGVISFSVEDLKTALYMQAKWMPLEGSVAIDMSYDSSGFTRIMDWAIQGTVRSDNVSMGGTQFSRLEPRIVLLRDSTPTDGPTFTRWEIRATPVQGGASRWVVPIANYAQVEIDNVTKARDPLEEVNFLIGLYRSGRLVKFIEAGQSYTVKVKDYLWKPEKLAPNGRAWEGVFNVVLEEMT